MSSELRIGMIGCGEIAYKATAKSIQAAENARMVIGMDPVEHVAQSFGETYDVEATTRTEDVLSRSDVDAVVISAPHYLHEPLTIQAAEAGKHVMVEKPIACNVKQADAMIDACAKAGVKLAVNLVSRYTGAAIRAKELIEQGAIGKVLALKFHVAADKKETYWTQGYSGRVQTDWRTLKEKSGGGILMMNLVHDIDRMRYITGLEAVRVYSEYDTFLTDVEVEDFITVSIRYDNGALGNILASSCARGGEGTGNRIYGADGQLLFGSNLRVFTTRNVEGLEQGRWNEVEVPSMDGRRIFVERFADAVFANQPPEIPGEEGRKTLEVIEAAYLSGERCEPVTLPL